MKAPIISHTYVVSRLVFYVSWRYLLGLGTNFRVLRKANKDRNLVDGFFPSFLLLCILYLYTSHFAYLIPQKDDILDVSMPQRPHVSPQNCEALHSYNFTHISKPSYIMPQIITASLCWSGCRHDTSVANANEILKHTIGN